MTTTLEPARGCLSNASGSSLPKLVGCIGQAPFSARCARYLNELCGADHFAAFHIGDDELTEVAASCVDPTRTAHERLQSYVRNGLWRQDPAIALARSHPASQQPALIRVNLGDSAYAQLRSRIYPDVADRLLVFGLDGTGRIGLSVLRNKQNAVFGEDAIDQVMASAGMLMSILAKHLEVRRDHASLGQALTVLGDIEDCITGTMLLPRREAQVCSRILYGLSSAGIALHLDVSEETVKTYRKRAYQRLGIGSERELLNWYLRLWSA